MPESPDAFSSSPSLGSRKYQGLSCGPESGRRLSSFPRTMMTRLRTIRISRLPRARARSVRTDMFIVPTAIRDISSARSGMWHHSHHAAPSGANGICWGRCYKHVGPNGPWPSGTAIESHRRGRLVSQVARKAEQGTSLFSWMCFGTLACVLSLLPLALRADGAGNPSLQFAPTNSSAAGHRLAPLPIQVDGG